MEGCFEDFQFPECDFLFPNAELSSELCHENDATADADAKPFREPLSPNVLGELSPIDSVCLLGIPETAEDMLSCSRNLNQPAGACGSVLTTANDLRLLTDQKKKSTSYDSADEDYDDSASSSDDDYGVMYDDRGGDEWQRNQSTPGMTLEPAGTHEDIISRPAHRAAANEVIREFGASRHRNGPAAVGTADGSSQAAGRSARARPRRHRRQLWDDKQRRPESRDDDANAPLEGRRGRRAVVRVAVHCKLQNHEVRRFAATLTAALSEAAAEAAAAAAVMATTASATTAAPRHLVAGRHGGGELKKRARAAVDGDGGNGSAPAHRERRR
jgi:hypothetical protein